MADLPFLQDQGGPPSQNINFAVSILDQGQPAPDVPWDAEQSIALNQTTGQLFQEVEHSGCFSGRAETNHFRLIGNGQTCFGKTTPFLTQHTFAIRNF